VECFSHTVGRPSTSASFASRLLSTKVITPPAPYFGDFVSTLDEEDDDDDDDIDDYIPSFEYHTDDEEDDNEQSFPIFPITPGPKSFESNSNNRREKTKVVKSDQLVFNHFPFPVFHTVDHVEDDTEEIAVDATSLGQKEEPQVFNPFSFPPMDTKENDAHGTETISGAATSLSEEQSRALDLIKQGRNVFVTGVAGTGKSLVLKKTLEYVQEHYDPKEYVAVAPTGSTAIALEGQTMHSFAGIGIPKIYKDFRKMKTNKNLRKKWENLKVLILDEVSMISGEFFDSLSKVVSDIRDDPRPFGGIQLIVCGDFLQLSPIAPQQWEVDQNTRALQEKEGLETPEEARDWLFLNRGFAFQSLAWKDADFELVELKQVFRQSNLDFVNVLQDIRVGRVTHETIRYLKENCERPLPDNELGIQPTILHSRNVDVTRENLVDLNKLSGETVSYQALDEVERENGVGPWVKKELEKNSFFKSCLAENDLQLKIGAQVMLIKNLNQYSLVNGSRGTVVGFRTVKNSSTSGVNLLPGMTKYPVVRFKNGLQQVITPQKFQSRILGKGTCTRTAIPLKLAWAITAHKAQGLTMDYVIADVGAVFAEAQLYVALSRASDATGLELRNFSRNRVRANALALQFHGNPKQEYPFWWEADGSKPLILIDTPSQKRTKKKRKQSTPKSTVAKSPGAKDTNEKPRSKVEPRSGAKTADKMPRSLSIIRNGSESDVETRPKPVHGVEMDREASTMTSVATPTPTVPTRPTAALNEDDLKQQTVVELKGMLRDRGLKVSGRKTELIERLFTFHQEFSTTQTTFEELKRRTVVELKFMLRKLGRRVSGRKAELIERLTMREDTTLECTRRTRSSRPDGATRASSGVSTRSSSSSSSGTHAKSFSAVHGHDSLQRRTVVELKGMLRERGLKVSGRKAELIERLANDNHNRKC